MFKKAVFLGNDQSDWVNISVSNPIDTLSLEIDDSPEKLVNFIHKHTGRFLAGFITYEYGVKQMGVPVDNYKDIPAVYFCAFDSSEKPNPIAKISMPRWEIFEPTISKKTYETNFKHIKDHIFRGNFYQINYTYHLKSLANVPAENLFYSFRKNNKVGYCAFFETNNWAIHSLSPEQFIKIKNGIITTKPIKGTIVRGDTKQEDKYNLSMLLRSEKEQSELYMIIDLLRNDLGKVCETDSVKVFESKSVKKLEKVFHTYGKIQGTLKSTLSPIEALISMLPGGSISGCPKKRACEIIHELELNPRGVYTGTIGYILPDGTLNFNIAIRTVVQQKDKLTLGVGGGITVDSNCFDEYEETLAKAMSFQP
tara:strand:+ start:1723 stop:2823 length:1101 start_codon:yes stop_codon:yes gene_type:complete